MEEVIEVSDHSGGGPYVGARVQVLFDVWYGGLIASQKEETGKWLVLFDDGDEETIVWPDPKGDVRILGAAGLSAKQNRTDKEGNEGSKMPRGHVSIMPVEHLEVSIERSREQHRPAERVRASEEIGKGSTGRLLHASSSPSACDLTVQHLPIVRYRETSRPLEASAEELPHLKTLRRSCSRELEEDPEAYTRRYTKELANCKSFDALSPTTSPRVVQVHAGVSLCLSRSLARSLAHSLSHSFPLSLSHSSLSLSLLDFHPTFNWVWIIPKAL
jgi:hypothetical protein